MNNQPEKKYVIGFDLNDQVSQLSYLEVDTLNTETMGMDTNEEKLGIPTVLCKCHSVSQWYFGTEAKRIAELSEGTLVGKLLSFARAGAKIELEGEAYESIDLLILFIKRALNMLTMLTSPTQVEALVFTVDTLEGRMLGVLEKIADAMKIDRNKIFFQTYEESCYYYLLHQNKDLWKDEAIIFDYSDNCLKAYELWLNHRTTPIVGFAETKVFEEIKLPEVMLDREHYHDAEEKLDEFVLASIHEYFSGKAVTSVFLIGDGFDGSWCEKTLRYLCLNKRVFRGKNLYAKGAAFCARDKVAPTELNKNYIFLGKDKLKFNLGTRMNCMGEEQYIAIVDAGENWYDETAQIDFLLDEGIDVPLVITPLDGKDPIDIHITLDGLPQRPRRASRLQLFVKFESEKNIIIRVKDLGFGEMYQSCNKIWEKQLEIV